MRLLGSHSISSAGQRFVRLLRGLGLVQTLALVLGSLDDKYLRLFDRRYHVRTSGFILLNQTSFDPSRLRDATQYGPVNGWGFRRMLRRVGLSRELRFVDLGCGLGRPCVLAAEYGFAHVTGVELAAEFCAVARANAERCRPPGGRHSDITILQSDVCDYCETSDDDVFFMFRPFSEDFLKIVLHKLSARAAARGKILTVIYSERALVSQNYAETIAAHPAFRRREDATYFGQSFYVFECRPMTASHDPAA